jgi:hypothetical protein
MVDWDWEARRTYESERIRIDARSSPVVLYDMKLPRLLHDEEVALMLSLADFRLERDLPFLALVRHERGTGVISARHRRMFADWLEARGSALARDDLGVVVVLPEAIFRAVLRVVYRFRAPPLRTLTTPDVSSAAAAVRSELARMGQPISPAVERLLDSTLR